MWLAALLGVLSAATLLAAVPMAQPVAAAPASPAAPPPPPLTGTVLDLALLDLRDQSWKPAPRLAPDHRGMQVVGLETWLAIDPTAWQTLSTFQSDGAIAVAATATPVRTVWVFSDRVIRCDGPGVEYTAGAAGPAPCGREWEHTTAVAPMALEVYIEYRVDWEASTNEKGTIDPLAGNSLGQFDLTVGEIQSVGTLGDDSHPNDPGITQADLGSRAACTLVMLSTGQCADPQDPPIGSEPGTGGKKNPDCGVGTFVSFWKWGSGDAVECVKTGAGELIDYVKEKATEIYALLPGPLKAVVDALAGCAEFGIDAVKNLWSSVQTLREAIADPQGFVTKQLDLLKSLKQALETDPEGFIKEFLGEQVDLQLLHENKAKWIGKMGCEVAVALFSAGVGSNTRIGRIFARIDDIRDWVKGKLHLPGGKDHVPGEGDPIPGDHIPGDGDPIPGDKPPDGDGPTCSLGGKCGCNSFPAGTLVARADGTPVPIEQIEPGDRVLTYDTVTAAWRSQPVLAQWSAIDHGSMATVTVAGGGTITATEHHRFWVDSRGAWVDLADVQPGDLLLTPEGATTVGTVAVGPITDTVVWELDVAFDDDFVVTQADTFGQPAASALVHNGSCKNRTEFGDALDSSAEAKADELLELNRLHQRKLELEKKNPRTPAEQAELTELRRRRDLVSNGELERKAALSEGGSFEHGVTSDTFTNLDGRLNRLNASDGASFDPATNTIRITDPDAYVRFVESKYADAGQTLNPKTKELIRNYITGQEGKPLSSFDGAPGLHAEIQAFNDVVNKLDAKGVPYTMSDIQVATRKLADGTGNPFPACDNCAGILPPEVTKVTG